MRHLQITRLAWLLTAVFAGSAILFAATRPAETPADPERVADAAAGADAFEAHCAQCHGPGEFEHWAERHPDPEERRAWLDSLLQDHFPPPEEARPLIIEHIEATLAGDG